jgi:Domain of unknown function (DUF4412)
MRSSGVEQTESTWDMGCILVGKGSKNGNSGSEEVILKTIRFLMLTVLAAVAARADFSYITVSKTPTGDRTSKHYLKGQKSITDDGSTVTILDYDAQTITSIDKAKKTYSVRPFNELANKTAAAGANVHADIKKTGQHKNINGFDTEETVMTVSMGNKQSKQPAATGQMQMEYDIWTASNVPGIEEMRAFYRKNADRTPWAALAGGNSGIAEIQRAMATAQGISVLTTVKTKMLNDQMLAQIEEMKKQGGQQAAMADKLLAQMGGSGPGITSESSGFSASPVPDSVFAIPAGFQKVNK